jgi:hypothetical protein
MQWDASPERMDALRRSIRKVNVDTPLRQVLAEDFPRDCCGLPIKGGWGYTQADAIVFVRDEFPPNLPRDFVSLEYHIAQKIIYEELIIFRATNDRFSGIDMQRSAQSLVPVETRKYDRLEFLISCWSDQHWDWLKKEWGNYQAGLTPRFDATLHAMKRKEALIQYERTLWFDITDMF